MTNTSSALLTVFGLAFAAAPALAAPVDAYAPLMRLQGRWSVTSGAGKTITLENRCAQTGLFLACEQVVDGTPAALVVFLPRGETKDGIIYRTQALRADGATPGPWYGLTIKGDDWIYAPIDKARDRTLNHFSGADHIHFETQTSSDGVTWTTQTSGDEVRLP